MATVNLKDLRGHLGDAAKLCEAAFQSDEEQPELDFEKVRTSLRAALGLLAEGSAGSGQPWTPTGTVRHEMAKPIRALALEALPRGAEAPGRRVRQRACACKSH
jgi:hypothetical protein